ncbi:FKBP-type peptidyl-prolyl cis-trans isomerase [Tahibacter soli]|uniref:Peptidyl-prolyl cis-trans isomerase n=1 Tax=Tahibacter soli TaxID=2983605 RepID=A0A9X4BHS6_9GAMM|nr:FKBP-type peptidyl-prolyl cis-trans isomerase [Tahibacter soli]MDC8014535.1 FKBP-type peptidyl-prolyl cis-trans isomerase [Tahibacter soli]
MSARGLVVAVAALLAAGCGSRDGKAVPGAPIALDTDRAKESYVVGLDIGRSLGSVGDDVDIEVVIAAVRTVHARGKPLLDDAQADAVRTALTRRLRDRRAAAQTALAAKNRGESQAFFARNANAPGVVATASGLQYQVLRQGQGASPNGDDTVRVNYVGARLDGAEFESTYATDHPAEFALGKVMPGLREALSHMAVGGRHRVWIPAALAYGDRGVPGQIEPDAALVYDIELLEIAQP